MKRETIWNETLKILSRTDQSASRLDQKLRKRGYQDAEIATALEKAKNYGFIDDQAYARRVAEKSRQKGKDDIWIAAKLASHGISRELILELTPREKVIEYLEDV